MTAPVLLAAALFLHPGPHAQQGTDEEAAGRETRRPASTQSREALGGGLYVITGRGGNILFFTGEDGTFVVDDQYAEVARENLALIEEVAEGPVAYVLNTHYHGDHTGGNPAFHEAGATIVARDNVRARLKAGDSGEALAAPGALPVITFEGRTSFHQNGQTIRAIALPNAHTDGDAMAYFEEADVLHTGDVLFSGLYPYIDVEAGGRLSGMMAALERVMQVAGPDTTIVPGHGPVGGEEAAEETLAVLEAAKERVQALIEEGRTREEVIAEKPLADYDERYAWRFISADRMAGQVYDSLMAEAKDGLPAYQESVSETLDGPGR